MPQYNKRIVITGVGVISPIGNDIHSFWEALKAGRSGVDYITRFDATNFPCKIAAEVKNFAPENYIEDAKRIRRMDLFTQYALAAAKMAIDDAGVNFEEEDRSKIGVILGIGIGGLPTLEHEHTVLLQKGPSRVSPFMIPKFIPNIACGEIAMTYKLRGPNYCVVSACASSTHAIGNALQWMRCSDIDMMITGGSEAAVTPLSVAGFSNMGALSLRNDEPKKASRPFDKERDGFVIGEGAGILILEELERAKRRNAKIYAEIVGFSATDDAYHITAPEPEATSVVSAIKDALKDAGILPEQVDYINAHGTSTPLNDKIETLAIKKAFGEHAYKLHISSTKSMIGHLLGAAGAVELIATVLCVKNNIVHPTINYTTPDPDCDLNYTPNECKEKIINYAMSFSLGFGGHNAVIVVKKCE
jgi:3-oxoacyl-[acyl-carrier-protein] synthase II